jgi:hypothetical protein
VWEREKFLSVVKKLGRGWACSSVVEHVISMLEHWVPFQKKIK